mgnify:CR=1 FL=1
MALSELALQAALIVLIPLAVGLLIGIDRKITARLQNRIGPPIVQPFYDLVKLINKRPMLLNTLQVTFAAATLMFQALAVGIIVTGGDLLIAFFISGAGSICTAMGAFSAASPYAYIGGHRKLLAILAYEPVLFLIILAIGLRRSFIVDEIGGGLLSLYPVAVLVMIPVLVILMEKSPYDVPTAHQELMSGPYVEYSGPYLAIMTLAHWFELGFIFSVFALFVWFDSPLLTAVGRVAIVLVVVFAAIIIDNITARLTRERMLFFTLTFGVGLMAVNVLIVNLFSLGVII